MDANTDVIQGTLDLLILKTLSLEPLHGFGIARRVEQISRGVFKVNPGSLLTALPVSNVPDGSTPSGVRPPIRGGRSITRSRAAGKRQLEAETADWTRRAAAVARILKSEA